jgi:copper transport protein
MAEITITPGRAGPITATIILTDGKGQALDPKQVSIALSNPAAGVEPITRNATRAADGTWQVTGLILPVNGIWQADLGVLVSDFEQVDLTGPLIVP